jgi:hypothetical protein
MVQGYHSFELVFEELSLKQIRYGASFVNIV